MAFDLLGLLPQVSQPTTVRDSQNNTFPASTAHPHHCRLKRSPGRALQADRSLASVHGHQHLSKRNVPFTATSLPEGGEQPLSGESDRKAGCRISQKGGLLSQMVAGSPHPNKWPEMRTGGGDEEGNAPQLGGRSEVRYKPSEVSQHV